MMRTRIKMGCAASLPFVFALLAATVRAQSGTDPAVDLLMQGTSATQAGNLAAAEDLFSRAVAVAPQLSDGFLGLGLVQLRRGELDAAISSLSHATLLNRQLRGAHLFLGIAQYQAGQASAAVPNLRAELALDGDSLEALRWLGIVFMALDRPEEAVPPLDHLAALKPNDPQTLYYQARAHQAVAKAALSKLYALDPDSALVHRALGESLEDSGEPEKAVVEFQAAIRKSPNDPDVLEELGNEEQKLSRFDDASAAYEQELKLNPHGAIAFYNLGKIDVERGKPAEGVALLRRAQAAHAVASPTDFYLGLGLAETGQNEEAAQWLKAALASDPPDFVQQGAWYQLARVYQRLNRKPEQQDALAHLKVVLDAQNRAKEATAKAARAQTPAAEPARP